MWSGVGGHKTVDERADPRLPMRLEAEEMIVMMWKEGMH